MNFLRSVVLSNKVKSFAIKDLIGTSFMRSNQGFTLVELVAIILLIAVLSTYATFNLPNLTVNVDGQAQQLADDLRFTQSLAMTKGNAYQLVILSNTTYQIQIKSTSTPITLAQGNTTVTLNSGITFGSYTTSTISFDGRGTPYDSTGTALSSNASIPLTGESLTKTVIVTPVTGRVTVQ